MDDAGFSREEHYHHDDFNTQQPGMWPAAIITPQSSPVGGREQKKVSGATEPYIFHREECKLDGGKAAPCAAPAVDPPPTVEAPDHFTQVQELVELVTSWSDKKDILALRLVNQRFHNSVSSRFHFSKLNVKQHQVMTLEDKYKKGWPEMKIFVKYSALLMFLALFLGLLAGLFSLWYNTLIAVVVATLWNIVAIISLGFHTFATDWKFRFPPHPLHAPELEPATDGWQRTLRRGVKLFAIFLLVYTPLISIYSGTWYFYGWREHHHPVPIAECLIMTDLPENVNDYPIRLHFAEPKLWNISWNSSWTFHQPERGFWDWFSAPPGINISFWNATFVGSELDWWKICSREDDFFYPFWKAKGGGGQGSLLGIGSSNSRDGGSENSDVGASSSSSWDSIHQHTNHLSAANLTVKEYHQFLLDTEWRLNWALAEEYGCMTLPNGTRVNASAEFNLTLEEYNRPQLLENVLGEEAAARILAAGTERKTGVASESARASSSSSFSSENTTDDDPWWSCRNLTWYFRPQVAMTRDFKLPLPPSDLPLVGRTYEENSKGEGEAALNLTLRMEEAIELGNETAAELIYAEYRDQFWAWISGGKEDPVPTMYKTLYHPWTEEPEETARTVDAWYESRNWKVRRVPAMNGARHLRPLETYFRYWQWSILIHILIVVFAISLMLMPYFINTYIPTYLKLWKADQLKKEIAAERTDVELDLIDFERQHSAGFVVIPDDVDSREKKDSTKNNSRSSFATAPADDDIEEGGSNLQTRISTTTGGRHFQSGTQPSLSSNTTTNASSSPRVGGYGSALALTERAESDWSIGGGGACEKRKKKQPSSAFHDDSGDDVVSDSGTGDSTKD